MLKSVFFVVIGVLLLFAMNAVIDDAFTHDELHMLPIIQLNMLFLLFGFLMQRKKIERILKQKSIQPNNLLFPALFLIVINIIPFQLWTDEFSHYPILFNLTAPLTHIATHSIIGIVAGFLLIQAIHQNNN